MKSLAQRNSPERRSRHVIGRSPGKDLLIVVLKGVPQRFTIFSPQ
jgi:hypothetical protein